MPNGEHKIHPTADLGKPTDVDSPVVEEARDLGEISDQTIGQINTLLLTEAPEPIDERRAQELKKEIAAAAKFLNGFGRN